MLRAFWNGHAFISKQLMLCWFTSQKVTWAKILAICQVLFNMPILPFLKGLNIDIKQFLLFEAALAVKRMVGLSE